jgi:hypothetical protein
MIEDPALGRTRAENALGKEGVRTESARLKEFRMTNVGQFSGPRPSYGQYSVSPNASDALNKSKRNKGER